MVWSGRAALERENRNGRRSRLRRDLMQHDVDVLLPSSRSGSSVTNARFRRAYRRQLPRCAKNWPPHVAHGQLADAMPVRLAGAGNRRRSMENASTRVTGRALQPEARSKSCVPSCDEMEHAPAPCSFRASACRPRAG
jgi:hypothetical protein